ncbi:hypothetical protein ACHAXT_001212 [Thalassiosira profunda]
MTSDEAKPAAAAPVVSKPKPYKPPPPPPTTNFPDSAPLEGEEMILSISCGNSHLHWATHFGEAEDYNPQIFWRTPHLKQEEIDNEDHLAILSRNLPDDPHDFIFGATEATPQNAAEKSATRAQPKISVYVVATNMKQAQKLQAVWKTVPSRFFVMRGDDFFSKDEGRYDTMGTDRLATLTGAVHLHGHPALVFDGGTATTYSATDGEGCILGGGIGPGIQSKFRSLSKDTAALPEISTKEVLARVQEAQEEGKPLPTFAKNTQEAMMGDAFQEFALKGRNVIEQWVQKAYRKESRLAKYNEDRRVICTGGDGDLLMQLLQPHYGGVIETSPKKGAAPPGYTVEASKHLIHYGVASALVAAVAERKNREQFGSSARAHVGKRVAKHFDVEAEDGDNIFRGKVAKIVARNGGKEEFFIQYDDGDSEDVSESELLDMFKLYAKHGEKQPMQPPKKKAKKENGNKAPAAVEKKKAEVPSFPMKSDVPAAKKRAAPSEAKKPVVKKAKTAAPDVAAMVDSANPKDLVRKRVSKNFDGDVYYGTIMEYDDSETPPFWHVEYDDGDEEDMDKKDLIKALKHYEKHRKDDPNMAN